MKTFKLWLGAVLAALFGLSAVGCAKGGADIGAQLKAMDEIHCPVPATHVDLDVSGSGRGEQLLRDRLNSVRGFLTEGAVCGSRVSVSAFSKSSAASKVLFDGDLEPRGATRRARERHTPKVVDAALDRIERDLRTAVRTLPAHGSDPIGALQTAADWKVQIGGKEPLRVVVLTDGIQTSMPNLDRGDLTTDAAAALGDTAVVPRLPAGTEITFGGLGKTANSSAPPAYIQSLKSFYLHVCQKADAARCAAVTTMAPEVAQ
ncbi:hypothetical protein ABT173_01520 [Streptomyces sp. NPDC001795]|uniref:hypothetical protein n=1 Tax=Streptomyces sp. NPDC001795 TaxID=3154525 RepID=UPI00331C5B36